MTGKSHRFTRDFDTFSGPITADQVPALALGCAILGSGGGGDVSAASALLAETLKHTSVHLTRVSEIPADAPCSLVGAVGSPTVMLERIPGHGEFTQAVRSVEKYSGIEFQAVAPLEIGGVNGLLGINAAARLGLSVLDVDAMGRALPRLDQLVTLGAAPLTPLALAQPAGGVLLLDQLGDETVEHAVRSVLPALGTWAAVCLQPMTAQVLRRNGVIGSISRAWGIGHSLLQHSAGEITADELAQLVGLRTLWHGTVAEVLRSRHHTEGTVTLTSGSSTARVDFAHEYLAALVDGELQAGSPDIITLLDERTKLPIAVDRVRVGQRLRLASLPAPIELERAAPRLGVLTVNGADT